MKTTVTLAELEAYGACGDYLEKFGELFGEGPVEVTRELCDEHYRDFRFDWAAYYMLTERGYHRCLAAMRPSRRALRRVREATARGCLAEGVQVLRRQCTVAHEEHVWALAFAAAVDAAGLADLAAGDVVVASDLAAYDGDEDYRVAGR